MAAIEEFITTYKNSGTKRNYRSGIQKFLAWKYSFQISGTKATFEERKKFDLLADDYITRDQNYSKDIVDFISNCDNHDIPAKSIRNWTAIVKEWLAGHNEIPLNDSRIRKKLPKGNGGIEQKIPKMDSIREIVTPAKFKTRFLVIFLVSTGTRINEALSVRSQDIEERDGIGVVSLKSKHIKTNNPRTVFLTPECLDLYKIWMGSKREEYLKCSERRSSRFLDGPRKDSVFPFDDSTASYMLQTALKHSNLLNYHEENTIDGRKRKTIHLHLFRSFFDTTCALNGMPDPVRYSIIGHQKTGMDQIYLRIPEDVKEREFRKVVPFLTVLQDVIKASETSRLKDAYEKQQESFESQIQKIQDEMNTYKKVLAELMINRMVMVEKEPNKSIVPSEQVANIEIKNKI